MRESRTFHCAVGCASDARLAPIRDIVIAVWPDRAIRGGP
jgi:hypothetical protein